MHDRSASLLGGPMRAAPWLLASALIVNCGGGAARTNVATPTEVDLTATSAVTSTAVEGDASESGPAQPSSELIPVGPEDAVSGAPDALVTLVQFQDYECPFCSRVQPTVARLREEYSPRQLRVVFKHNPLTFHPRAMPAANFAMEARAEQGDKGFWAYHDLLFQNQRALGRENLEKYAEQVGGIDMKAFKAALDSGKHKAAVDADIAAVNKAGARIGTPSFFINGKLLQGAQPYAAFKAAVDSALK